MKIARFLSRAITVLCFAGGALVPAPALAQTTPSDWDSGNWQFTGENKSGKQIENLNMGGPMIGVTFRW